MSSAIKILEEQAEDPNARFLRNATECMHGTIKWVCELREREPPSDLNTIGIPEVTEFLKDAVNLFGKLNTQGDTARIRSAKRRTRTAVEWVNAIEYAESRRTMPKTNVRQCGAPNPILTFGYRFRQRNN